MFQYSRMLWVVAFLTLTLATRADAEVRLRLSQPVYAIGEPVSFTLSNESKWVITLPNAIGWWRVHNVQQDPIGGCTVQPTTFDLHPGYSISDSWDQVHCIEGVQVPPRSYLLTVDYTSECCPGEFRSITVLFRIGVVPVEALTWGRIKANFAAD
jgi:hypothetical protein